MLSSYKDQCDGDGDCDGGGSHMIPRSFRYKLQNFFLMEEFSILKRNCSCARPKAKRGVKSSEASSVKQLIIRISVMEMVMVMVHI